MKSSAMIWVRHLTRNPQPVLRQCRAFTTGGSRIVNVQPVKIKRPWFRRFATSVLVYGAAFHLWTSLVHSQLQGYTIPDSDSSSGGVTKGLVKGGEEDFDEEDVTFIPLSWPRLEPGKLYTGNDEEWKDFQKYATDSKRIEALRAELEDVVCAQISRHPQYKRLLGEDVKTTQSWLMAQFPYRAPPHYETLGFEITDNQVVLKSKSVPPEQGRLIVAALFPFAVTSALGSAASIYIRRKLRRVKSALGIDQDPTNEVIMSIKSMNVSSDLRPSTNISLSTYSDWEKSMTTTAGETNRLTDTAQSQSQSQSQSESNSSRLPKFFSAFLTTSFQSRKSDIYVAYVTFKLHLMKHQMRENNPVPPRGVFYLTGPVGLIGSKARCRFEVRGEYDPKNAEWSSVSIELKDFSYISQEPLGYLRPS